MSRIGNNPVKVPLRSGSDAWHRRNFGSRVRSARCRARSARDSVTVERNGEELVFKSMNED